MPLKLEIVFLFIGGVHQVAHLAPVAAEVSRLRPDLAVSCICADAETDAALREVRTRMAAPRLMIDQWAIPWPARIATRLARRRAAAKGPILAAVHWRARQARLIVVPERTSAALRWMGWRRPLVHFRHGAGDRAPRSERRLSAFDLIVVAGEKDIERAVAQGIDRHRLRDAGYVKLDYTARAAAAAPPLFNNARPVVLYNPHFDPAQSSIGIARAVIARFAAQDRYNLIFAPHARAVEDLSHDARAAWMALAVPGRIIIDLGSSRLFDMSYTGAADLYLGDMSSQLYEFLVRPRPVAFVDAHGADWRDDPRYVGWSLGEVAHGADAVLGASTGRLPVTRRLPASRRRRSRSRSATITGRSDAPRRSFSRSRATKFARAHRNLAFRCLSGICAWRPAFAAAGDSDVRHRRMVQAAWSAGRTWDRTRAMRRDPPSRTR